MKIDLELYEQIRHLHLHDGMSQRAISRKLDISRNTVSKYCNGEHVPWERKEYSSRSTPVVTDEVKDFILKCFEEDDTHSFKSKSILPQGFINDYKTSLVLVEVAQPFGVLFVNLGIRLKKPLFL
ncbi:protein of unknown function [Petrocella atlantisensis]|uniref:HTH cro/C1-type domain-containing protein n=1 Tax=Petrocella atlantisensis TaxID=2173034 RepID=A0A3P7P306_9FIRM|nr:helix-turn-helix domain-containing protein [Petrocella atlantisensis]VDN47900.1 protein of unknown function [Petrocella atlantisensis]